MCVSRELSTLSRFDCCVNLLAMAKYLYVAARLILVWVVEFDL
jgi:hypothetical protein